MEANNYIDGVKWYVVHTYSGYENKVKTNLEKIVDNRSLQNLIFDIRIPTETVIEGEGESAKEVEVKIFPSYVIVKMIMSDFTWHIIRNITGVTGFVGPGSKPVPLSEEEMIEMGLKKEAKEIVFDFEIGDAVYVVSGVWENTQGIIKAIDAEKQTVTIAIDMFGRETPVEIGFTDVRTDK